MSKADFQQVVPVDGKCFQHLSVSFFPRALHLKISRDLSNCSKKDQKIVRILTSNEVNMKNLQLRVIRVLGVVIFIPHKGHSTVTHSTSAELCVFLKIERSNIEFD